MKSNDRTYPTATSKASTSTKVVYCLTLAAMIFPFGGSGWIAATVGGTWLGKFSLIPLALIFLIGVARILRVIRQPATLDFYVYSPLQKLLATCSRWLLYVGAFAFVLRFFVPLITRATIGAGENGIGYYVIGLGVTLLGAIGPGALLLFEYARTLGFEQHRQEMANRPTFEATRPL